MQNKYFIVSVDEKLHKEIKLRALNQGITLKAWIMRAITEKIKNENENNKDKQ